MATAAQIRRIKRERRIELRKCEDRDEMAMHADEIMRAYEETYHAYNGVKIVLCYVRGFVRIDGARTPRRDGGQIIMKGYRLKEIQAMTRELDARIHEQNMREMDDA